MLFFVDPFFFWGGGGVLYQLRHLKNCHQEDDPLVLRLREKVALLREQISALDEGWEMKQRVALVVATLSGGPWMKCWRWNSNYPIFGPGWLRSTGS